MLVDYVVISSNQNPLYLDFYGVACDIWNHFGFKVFMIEICDTDEEKQIGDNIYKKVKSCPGMSDSVQAQIVRFYSAKYLDNLNFMISDIDMIPLQKEFFLDFLSKGNDDNIICVEGPDTYLFHPMCYIAGKGNVVSKTLGFDNMSFQEFVTSLHQTYHSAQNTDETYFFHKTRDISNKVIVKRNFAQRIDRCNNMSFNEQLLKEKYYIDCHMSRPYSQYKNQIVHLINSIKI
jgi:hypothetical protein